MKTHAGIANMTKPRGEQDPIAQRCNDFMGRVRSAIAWLQDYHQRRGAQRREDEWRSRLEWREEAKDVRRANRRALTLLLKQLSPEQRQTFRTLGYFFVTGAHSSDRYCIRAEMNANIDVLDHGTETHYRLCVLPNGGVPIYDVMAAQLLYLQDPQTEKLLIREAKIYPARTRIPRSPYT